MPCEALIALGAEPAYRLLLRSGRQVSVSWRTPGRYEQARITRADAGGAVPAWRTATVPADPTGEAEGLQAKARTWDWSLNDEAANKWVAEQGTGYAEQVHRLVGAGRR